METKSTSEANYSQVTRMGNGTEMKQRCNKWSLGNPQTPFALPFLKLHHNTFLSDSPQLIHRSIATAAHNFLRCIHSLASQNPFLSTLVSLHSQFHTFCAQIQCSNYRNRNVSSLSAHNFAAVLPGDSVAGLVVANGLSNFFNIYNTLLVVRLVLTWFPNAPPAIVSPLSTICDPYLNIFRGLIPPLGGTLDLSPILAFLVLNAFTSTAAALPAELPPHLHSTNVTASQSKWIRRVQGKDSKASNSAK